MPPDVADYFLSELAKVFNEEDNLSKFSAFFYFCLDEFTLRRIFAHKTQSLQTSFGYSVVKYLKKQKGAATYQVSFENFPRHRS